MSYKTRIFAGNDEVYDLSIDMKKLIEIRDEFYLNNCEPVKVETEICPCFTSKPVINTYLFDNDKCYALVYKEKPLGYKSWVGCACGDPACDMEVDMYERKIYNFEFNPIADSLLPFYSSTLLGYDSYVGFKHRYDFSKCALSALDMTMKNWDRNILDTVIIAKFLNSAPTNYEEKQLKQKYLDLIKIEEVTNAKENLDKTLNHIFIAEWYKFFNEKSLKLKHLTYTRGSFLVKLFNFDEKSLQNLDTEKTKPYQEYLHNCADTNKKFIDYIKENKAEQICQK